MPHSLCSQSLTAQGSTVSDQICLTECEVGKEGAACCRRKETTREGDGELIMHKLVFWQHLLLAAREAHLKRRSHLTAQLDLLIHV